MVADGMPVEMIKNSQGELAIVQFTGDHWLMVRSPEGGSVRWSDTYGREDDPLVREAAEEFFSRNTIPALMIDGVDFTTTYSRCLETSGYDWEAAWGTVNMDVDLLSRQIDANNMWAGCARAHGFPEIEDCSVPLGSDESDWPAVLVPVTISPPQLRQLLNVCPSFDAQRQEFMATWWQANPTGGYPVDYLPNPNLDFFLPSLAGSNDPNKEPTDQEKVALENIDALYKILYEDMTNYWAGKANQEPPLVTPSVPSTSATPSATSTPS